MVESPRQRYEQLAEKVFLIEFDQLEQSSRHRMVSITQKDEEVECRFEELGRGVPAYLSSTEPK